MKTLTLWYLAGYLLFGGIGFASIPQPTLRLFLSTGNYDDTMVRVAGMFMIMLGGLIATMAFRKDFTYYRYSILARTFAVAFLLTLYFVTTDPLFLVLTTVVLIGLLPSMYVAFHEGRT